jgi:hypothetical protein
VTGNWNFAKEQLAQLKGEIKFFKQLGDREGEDRPHTVVGQLALESSVPID